ncbi:hypothetical protein [Marinobacter salarius]
MNNALYLLIGLYALSIFSVSTAVVELAGFFPAGRRPETLRGAAGTVVLGLVVALTLALAFMAVWQGVNGLPWPWVVIAGGLAFLAAPLAFQAVSPSFWDSPAGIISVGAILAVLLMAHLILYVF